MARTHRGEIWVGIVCDTSSATLLLVRGRGPAATLIQQQHIAFDADELQHSRRLADLEQFVTAHNVRGAPASVAFFGARTIVEPLQLPPLGHRDQRQAIQTRLARFMPTSELSIAVHTYPPAAQPAGATVLAAGVELTLSRAVLAACRRAHLRVARFTALASAIPPPSGDGRIVQLLLTERTSSIQLFDAGRLVSCRGVLLGWRDFLTAYQRPILTETGAVTLSATDAERLCRSVGVPYGRDDEVHPGVYAIQLWPMLNPVLQKLRHEVAQTLLHSQVAAKDATISVAGAPSIPGLAEHLADDLQMAGVALPTASAAAHFLAALSGPADSQTTLDLSPPEERFNRRLTLPALAAGLCALLVVFANSAGPRHAAAAAAELRPLTTQLRNHLVEIQQKRDDAAGRCAQLVEQLQRQSALSKVLPPALPVAELLKGAFRDPPAHVQLLDVQLQAQAKPVMLKLRGTYRGDVPASIVAAQWARTLSNTPFVAGAKVDDVTGSGQPAPALIAIQATLK